MKDGNFLAFCGSGGGVLGSGLSEAGAAGIARVAQASSVLFSSRDVPPYAL